MAGYRSRLDPVIRQRKYIEDEAQQEFVETNNRFVAEEDQLKKVYKDLEQAFRDLNEKQAKGMRADEVDLFYRFIKQQCQRLEERRVSVKRLSDQRDEKREVLAKAVQEKKMVEKMDDIRKQSYFKELQKKEQGLLDEVAGRQKRKGP